MGFSFRVRPAAEADCAASMVRSRAVSRTEEMRESDSMVGGRGEGGAVGSGELVGGMWGRCCGSTESMTYPAEALAARHADPIRSNQTSTSRDPLAKLSMSKLACILTL